MLSLGLTW